MDDADLIGIPTLLEWAHRLHVPPKTLQRWIVQGYRGTKLHGCKSKGGWHISFMAMQRFEEALGTGFFAWRVERAKKAYLKWAATPAGDPKRWEEVQQARRKRHGL